MGVLDNYYGRNRDDGGDAPQRVEVTAQRPEFESLADRINQSEWQEEDYPTENDQGGGGGGDIPEPAPSPEYTVVITAKRPPKWPSYTLDPADFFRRGSSKRVFDFESFQEWVEASKEQDDNPFSVPRGQLTFDAEGKEGGKLHSRKPHHPSATSGVTIGRGYDMKLKRQKQILADLLAAGVPKADAKALSKAGIPDDAPPKSEGLSGAAADKFIADPAIAKIEISPEAQKALFLNEYDHKVAEIERISSKKDTSETYGTVDFARLHPAILEIAVDLLYRGDYTGKTRVVIQPHLVDNSLQGLYKALTRSDPFSPRDALVHTDIGNIPRERFLERQDFMEEALEAEKGKKP